MVPPDGFGWRSAAPRTLGERGDVAPARRRSDDRCALRRSAFGAALLAHAPHDALAPVLFQARVEAADLDEHRVSYGLLLLARGVLDGLPAHRLAVLDRHLRELQPLPVADPLR